MKKEKEQILVQVINWNTGKSQIGIASSKRDSEELATKMILNMSNKDEMFYDQIKKLQGKRKFRSAIKIADEDEQITSNFFPIERENSIILEMD
jgi:hypothetical protein